MCFAQEPAGEKTTGTGTSVFNSAGAIGKQFTCTFLVHLEVRSTPEEWLLTC